jgi:superfamily II DNA/RNA helicase
MPSTVQVVTVDTVLSEEAFSTHLRFMRDPMAIATDSSHGVFPPGVDQYTVEVEAEEHKLATLLDLLGGSPAETRSDTLQPRSEARGRGNWDEARWSEAGDATAAVVVESPRSEPDAGDGGVSAAQTRPPPPPPPQIEGMAQMVIFCNSKRKVDWLTDRMLASNFPYARLSALSNDCLEACSLTRHDTTRHDTHHTRNTTRARLVVCWRFMRTWTRRRCKRG